jgi:hypothetical protein
MNSGKINYANLLNKAMLGIIHNAFKIVETHGLQNGHYFLITFSTQHAKVVIDDSLKSKYPNKLTIILQYQYKNLKVTQTYFRVQLFFGGMLQELQIPFDSIIYFFDPSANFELCLLQFEKENLNKIMELQLKSSKPKQKSVKGKQKKDNILVLKDFRKTKDNE